MTKRIISLVTAVLMALLLPANLTAGTVKDADLDGALNAPGGTLTFVTEGAYPWQAVADYDDEHPDVGVSGNTGMGSSSSYLSTAVTIGEDGGSLAFDYMACGESSNYGYVFDHCIFKIDGEVQFDKGNEYDAGWQSFAVNLDPGEHTLQWSYTKDGSVNGPGDCFVVDNVAIGNAIPDEPEPTPEPGPEPPTDEELDNALNAEGGTIHFVNDAVYPWQVVEDADRVYAKSGNAGVESSTSTISAEVNVEAEGMMVRFDLIARGEGYDTVDWDTCRLFVDGEMVMKYGSHDEVWESFEYALTPGAHTLEWQYKKDHSTNPQGDYFAVDNVEILEGTPVLPEVIYEINILGFESPLWMHHPNYNITVPEDANYHIDEIMWQYADELNEDYGQLYEDEYFDNEYATYNLLVRIYPNDGYVISDDAAALIDGSTVPVGSYGNSVFGYFYIYSREYEVDPSVVDPTPAPPEPVGPIWDFETDPENQGWTFVDEDGDGQNWSWMVDWYNEYSFHEGYGFLMSMSFDNASGMPLYPDNWAITPEFEVPENGLFTFWAQGQDPDYPYEIFGVYIQTADEDWVQIGDDDFTWYVDFQFIYDISEYAGETVRMAIRHYNVSDQFEMNLDYVEVTALETPPTPEPYVLGDVNEDGEIDLRDALLTLRYSMGIIPEDAINPSAADVNTSHTIDVEDALLIMRYAIGVIDAFPAGE